MAHRVAPAGRSTPGAALRPGIVGAAGADKLLTGHPELAPPLAPLPPAAPLTLNMVVRA